MIPQFTLGDRLRKAREQTGLDQVELATKLRVGRSTVVRYENDQVDLIKIRTLEDWAEATGVPMWWFEKGLRPSPDGAPGVLCARRDSNPQPSDQWSAGARHYASVSSLEEKRERAGQIRRAVGRVQGAAA